MIKIKNIALVCGISFSSLFFIACGSDEDTIKALALEDCKKYADEYVLSKKTMLTNENLYEKVANTEIISIQKNGLKDEKDKYGAECQITYIANIDTDYQKKGEEVKLSNKFSYKKENGEWKSYNSLFGL
ncbi:hypothetical protein CQA53_05575 [Helicobacter didelphidarum]|uniref:DUF4878 domain-containing protein n=1 Tax=Helicobacter didelphidarum TaxID=2040648 RepID=A0A3D8IM89_9HELI|nr:hypothetical protein [Helicobacter didelphidarum]RDU65764.1 hypothetical protein CQA53_05575 [Helicobacter didelphidarum]